MNKDLPVFRLQIVDDNSSDVEVDFVAVVDRPAIEKSFLAFREALQFEVQEEMIISGPLMLADTPIYRSDANGEYYVIFEKETIKMIVQKFFRKGYQKNVNLMHDAGMAVDGLVMFESWITDEKRGIKAMDGFNDVPDGSWFGSFKVENDIVWQIIKEGKVKGFSVEGIFNYVKKDAKEDEMMAAIKNILKEVK
jgi:hypothetical protein